uniref:Cytochrome-c oxidase n=1 Tax=Heterorhabditis bacteriophora TaxID=37862 RepID=A0A1I7WCF6_HETBA
MGHVGNAFIAHVICLIIFAGYMGKGIKLFLIILNTGENNKYVLIPLIMG